MSNGGSELLFSGGGRIRALAVRRMAQARRMRLSVDPRDGAVRLVLPRRAALRHALAWVEGQRGWIEEALEKLPAIQPIAPGAIIPVEGTPHLIDWAEGRPRTVARADGRLVLGGAHEAVEGRILRWLRREALAVLQAETLAMATRAGVTVARVGVGDPRARWGSCSAAGDIRYSWRLFLAPPAVREATVAHEVAHRLHMDHSADFHAAVRTLLGREPSAERRWLRAHGPSLYWLGRSA